MNYVGPAPDASYYDIDHMHQVERKEFLVWYEAVAKKEVFDNRRVLEVYCQADVTVLREACRTFRKHYLQIGNVEVFLESITIASACNKLFRKKFLLPVRIGIIPVGGYTDKRKQSRKPIAWLLLEERRTGKKILHGRNGKERQLPEFPNIHVDGLSEEMRTVFEFNGFYFHEHTCQPFRDLPIACGGGTLTERYEQTMSRLERIAQAGYQIVIKWDCEFEPPEEEEEEERLPLKTRDALYGVRTEAMRLHYRFREGEETIQYVDVMSLYPWVCKYSKFPVGHPTIHLDFGDIPTMLAKEGLVRCTVLPPKNLYHPVLPYRCNGRLLFCLCRTCAEAGSQEQCSHVTDLERALTATWVADEVRLAV
jgi:G:T-mismatch repair DNA endonuclease (very short patch repair protein)